LFSSDRVPINSGGLNTAFKLIDSYAPMMHHTNGLRFTNFRG
jgi:hypothetical protein